MGLFDDMKPKRPPQQGSALLGGLSAPKPKQSLFRSDSDFRERAGLGVGDMLVAAAKDMFGGNPAEYVARQSGGKVGKDADGEPVVILPDGTRYRINDAGLDSTDVGNVAGNVASFFLPASWASRIGQAKNVGLAGRVALQAGAAGATDIGLQAATKGGDVDMGRAALVAAGGAGGELAGAALTATGRAAAAKVPKDVKALYDAAKARGINLTPAQLSDSKFVSFLRSQLAALPGSGAAGQEAKQRIAFNTATSRTVGESAPMSNQVFDEALDRLGGEFDRFASRSLPLTNGFVRNLEKIAGDAKLSGLDGAPGITQNMVDFVKRQPGGRIDGKVVQAIDTKLRKLATRNDDAGEYARTMREALHDHIEKNMPQADFDAWRTTRKEYRNAMKIMGLVAKDGEVSPGKLMGAVTNDKAGKRAMARGRGGELGELARIGQRMKPPPSSGSGERVQAAAVGAGFWANPLATLTGLTAGRVGRGALDSNMLAAAMMNRGAGRQALAPYVPAVGVGVMRYPYVATGNDGE